MPENHFMTKRFAMKITVLGARGSIPTNGEDMTQFGGATSCILVETDNTAIFLDAGTGITTPVDIGDKDIYVVLSHPHSDHLLGLPFFPYIVHKDRRIEVCATVKYGIGTLEQVSKLISEPLWPCTILDYPADVVCRDITLPVTLGDIVITGIRSNHPGHSSILKLTHEGASVVYATDYEHDDGFDDDLIEFIDGADLLLYDGQYTAKEYAAKKGFGHSTPERGVYIMQKSGARMLRIVHHDPHHNDDFLLEMESAIRSDNKSFARQGEVIWLQR